MSKPFQIAYEGVFGPYVLWPLDKKLIFWIVTRVSARDYTVLEIKTFGLESTIEDVFYKIHGNIVLCRGDIGLNIFLTWGLMFDI